MFRTLAAFLTAVLALAMPVASHAARVSPMIVNVEPMGRGSIARVELSNPGDSTFPVEVQMFRGDISENGELALTAADEDFLVFPPQRVIAANSQQVFRLQYIGDPELQESQIYYMQIRQIPVEFDPGRNQLQVVVNFNILVTVIPEDASAEPLIVSAESAVRDEVRGIEVRMKNDGTGIFNASSVPWTIIGLAIDGTPVTYNPSRAQLASIIGVGVVPPGKSRVFFVPTEVPLAEGSVQVQLDP